MNRPAKGSCLVGWAVVATLVGPAARAAERPLLVVVEAPPTLDMDAAEIRRAIGAELRCQTIAPMKTPVEPPERALIVAVDGERIAVSLRSGDATPVTRVIPMPVDRAARLRAIAWLAGNLARDQVTPIVTAAPAEPSPSATVSPLPAARVATEPPPASTAASPFVAPPSSPPPLSDPDGAAISIRAEPRSPPEPIRWSISGSIGPVIADVTQARGTWWGSFGIQPSTVWQLSVERRGEDQRLIIGGRLEGTYNNDGNGDGPQLFGADLFVGADGHFRYCRLEATLGAGPEAASVLQLETESYFLPGGGTATTPNSYSVYRVDLYAQATALAAIPLGASVEGLLGVGAHLNAFQDKNWFATATVGLRYTLQ